jgi:lysophospholipase L1-like esterase
MTGGTVRYMSHLPHFRRCENLPAFFTALAAGERRWLCCLGDSNTNNTDFTRGGKQWPELVHTALKRAAKTQTLMLANAGVSGDTVDQALARFDHDVARIRPDLTIVCLGTNDGAKSTDAAYTAGMNTLIDRLLALGSQVVLRTPAVVWEMSPSRIWPSDNRAWAYDRCRAIADERGLPLIDTHARWCALEAAGRLPLPGLMADAIHTNAAGHRLVAGQILEAFGLSADDAR